MRIAIPLYPGFTALDAVGPYTVLAFAPGCEVTFVAGDAGPVVDDQGDLSITATATYDDLPDPDVVVVPGGPGTVRAMGDARLVGWIRTAHATTTVHHLGVQRRVPARGGRSAGGPPGHHPLGLPRPAGRTSASSRSPGASSPRGGSSPPPGCRRASTWRWNCWPCCATRTPPGPCSSPSSTTPPRPSLPDRPRPPLLSCGNAR